MDGTAPFGRTKAEWRIDILNVTPQQLQEIENLKCGGNLSQVQESFLEDLHSLLNIRRDIAFREHFLMIKVTPCFVEYQEVFKMPILAEQSGTDEFE